MFASRILRNVGTTGNRLMNEGPKDKTMLYGAGALVVLTSLVYWAGYKAEGSVGSRNKEHLKKMEDSSTRK